MRLSTGDGPPPRKSTFAAPAMSESKRPRRARRPRLGRSSSRACWTRGSADAIISDSLVLAGARRYDHAALVGVIKSLAAEGYVSPPTVLKVKGYVLTKEGRARCRRLTRVSPERRARTVGHRQGCGPRRPGEQDAPKNGKKNAMQKRWCAFDKATKKFTRSQQDVKDATRRSSPTSWLPAAKRTGSTGTLGREKEGEISSPSKSASLSRLSPRRALRATGAQTTLRSLSSPWPI